MSAAFAGIMWGLADLASFFGNFELSDWIREAAAACARLLVGQWPVLLAAVAGAVLIAYLERRVLRRERLGTLVFGASLAAALTAGLWQGSTKLWLCDDAFISFRYAWNFAHGQGLVFNPGEWVEGYTNFLWVVLLGTLGKLGADIPYAGLFGNVGAFLGVLALAAIAARRASPSAGRSAAAIPWAAIALAGSAAFTTWMTSGLETMPATACVVGAVALVAFGARPWLVGLALAAAALMRPDHLLFAPAMAVAFAVEDLRHETGPLLRRLRWRRHLALAAPVALTFVPYWLARWHVYGDFYPNTYYAKSGGEAYWSQGWLYLTHFLGTTGAWLAAPALVLTMLLATRSRMVTALRTFAITAALLLGAYVVRVGGDFMEHRFLVVLLPVIAIALEVSVRWHCGALTARPLRWGLALLGLAAAAVALVPVRPIEPMEKRWNLAAEQTFYPVTRVFPLAIKSGLFDKGQALARLFPEAGLKPRLAEQCVGFISYYSKLPITDAFGLTSRQVAHKPLERRGRPGHEKWATFEEVLADGAVISDGPTWPGEDALTRFEVEGLRLHFVRFDARIAARVLQAGGTVADPRAFISRLAADRRRDQVLAKTAFLREYLRSVTEREAWLAPLNERLHAIADFEGVLPAGSESRGEVRLESGTPPPGASGRGWLSVRRGRAVVPVPEGLSEIRFALGGAGARSSVRLEVPAASGAFTVLREAAPGGDDSLAPVAWLLEARTPAGARLVAEAPEPGSALLLDAVHAPPPGESAMPADAEAIGGREVFELLRALETELPDSDPRLAGLRSRLAARWTFDDDALPDGVGATGPAFARPEAGPVPGQQVVRGQQGGRLLNGYAPGDEATGRLEFELPEADHLTVGALVGGGADCARVFFGLLVNGKVRAHACGQNDEVLRPVVLEAKVAQGDAVQLVAVDEATGGWGHLLLDDVQVIARPRAPDPRQAVTGTSR